MPPSVPVGMRVVVVLKSLLIIILPWLIASEISIYAYGRWNGLLDHVNDLCVFARATAFQLLGGSAYGAREALVNIMQLTLVALTWPLCYAVGELSAKESLSLRKIIDHPAIYWVAVAVASVLLFLCQQEVVRAVCRRGGW